MHLFAASKLGSKYKQYVASVLLGAGVWKRLQCVLIPL